MIIFIVPLIIFYNSGVVLYIITFENTFVRTSPSFSFSTAKEAYDVGY